MPPVSRKQERFLRANCHGNREAGGRITRTDACRALGVYDKPKPKRRKSAVKRRKNRSM